MYGIIMIRAGTWALRKSAPALGVFIPQKNPFPHRAAAPRVFFRGGSVIVDYSCFAILRASAIARRFSGSYEGKVIAKLYSISKK